MKKKGYKSLIVFLIMFLFLVSAVVALTFAKDKVQSFERSSVIMNSPACCGSYAGAP